MKKKMMIVLAVLAAVLIAAAAFGLAMGNKAETGVNEMSAVQEETVLSETIEEEAAALQDGDAEEDAFEVAELYGTVVEVTDAYVLLESAQVGMVQANLTDDTIVEGTEMLEAGQVVKVIYDGKMTRSIPAQINAMLIGVYAVTGEVVGEDEGSVTVRRADTQQDVIITLPEDAGEIALGDVITAYTTGMATMSLPPLMNAVAIVK